MSPSQTALLVIDVQESFRHRPYWSDRDVPLFFDRLQPLIVSAPDADNGFVNQGAQTVLGKAPLVVGQRGEFALVGFAAFPGAQVGKEPLRAEEPFRCVGMQQAQAVVGAKADSA